LSDYHWKEFWSAILGLLAFLSNKLENLVTTGGVEELVRQVCGLVQLELVGNYLNELYQTISLLDLSLCKAEVFLPRPQSIHAFIVSHGSRSFLIRKQTLRDQYELARSSSVLKQQAKLLRTLSISRRTSWTESREPLAQILLVAEFYEERIGKAGPVSAKQGMQIISSEIDAEGLFGVKDVPEPEAPPFVPLTE
jgi:hypothetical protein